MPVTCPLEIAPLSAVEFGKLDFLVMGHAFASQNSLGRLADERIYQNDLANRLSAEGMKIDREIPIHLTHGSFNKKFSLDMVVDNKAVYELKVVRKLDKAHFGQLLTYLQLLDLSRGKLVNFRPRAVESRFVNAPLTSSDRRDFSIDDSSFDGDSVFRNLVIGLIRDWGTSLTIALYREAITALLGGTESVDALLPLMRQERPLGNQRFQLASRDTAFRLTAMNREAADYRKQLQCLLDHSPLRSIQWVNIAIHKVTLSSLKRS